jgi:hypothetical protein
MSDEMHHISLSQERNEHPQQQLGQKEGQLSDPLDDGDLTISVWTHLYHSTATRAIAHRLAIERCHLDTTMSIDRCTGLPA